MLTIKSDDVYGRSKAYESIIKQTPIVGPKVPESFNVLVKELQGLGLKVDLVHSENIVDAESILAKSINLEGENQSSVLVPQPIASDIDVTDEIPGDDFSIVDLDDDLSDDSATVSQSDDDLTATTSNDDLNGEEEKI